MKKLLFIIIVIVSFAFCSCKHTPEPTVPADLIPRDTMINLIAETWLMESSIAESQINFGILENAVISLYDDFFKRHNITKDQFTHSIEYYLETEEDAEAFIRECQEQLETKKDEFIGEGAPTSCPQ